MRGGRFLSSEKTAHHTLGPAGVTPACKQGVINLCTSPHPTRDRKNDQDAVVLLVDSSRADNRTNEISTHADNHTQGKDILKKHPRDNKKEKTKKMRIIQQHTDVCYTHGALFCAPSLPALSTRLLVADIPRLRFG